MAHGASGGEKAREFDEKRACPPESRPDPERRELAFYSASGVPTEAPFGNFPCTPRSFSERRRMCSSQQTISPGICVGPIPGAPGMEVARLGSSRVVRRQVARLLPVANREVKYVLPHVTKENTHMQRRYAAWALDKLGGRKMLTCEKLGIDSKTLAKWPAFEQE